MTLLPSKHPLILMLLLLLFTGLKSEEISFKNITIIMMKIKSLMDRETQNIQVESSSSLKESLLSSDLTAVTLRGNIPILYKDSITDISNVELMYLNHVGLQEIHPGALKNLEIMRLDFQFNELTHIEKGVFNELQIHHLILSNNKIATIDSEAFDNMPNLANIFLNTNKIDKINVEWFKNTKLLYRLFLAGNLIQEVPEGAFVNIYNSKKQWINLQSNEITQIHEGAFRGLKLVDILDLSWNKITTWNDKILPDIDLMQDLRINNNVIASLEGDLDVIFKGNVTRLGGNPLDDETKARISAWKKENPARQINL